MPKTTSLKPKRTEAISNDGSFLPSPTRTSKNNPQQKLRNVDFARQDVTATEVFLAWEKLRVAYNIILV